MEIKGIDRNEDDPHNDAKQHIDKGNDEFLGVGPHLRQDREGLAASLVLELTERQGHRMLKPVCKNSRPELLDDHIPAIILEGLRDPGYHGYPDEDAQVTHQAPDIPRFRPDSIRDKFFVRTIVAFLEGVYTEFV